MPVLGRHLKYQDSTYLRKKHSFVHNKAYTKIRHAVPMCLLPESWFTPRKESQELSHSFQYWLLFTACSVAPPPPYRLGEMLKWMFNWLTWSQYFSPPHCGISYKGSVLILVLRFFYWVLILQETKLQRVKYFSNPNFEECQTFQVLLQECLRQNLRVLRVRTGKV